MGRVVRFVPANRASLAAGVEIAPVGWTPDIFTAFRRESMKYWLVSRRRGVAVGMLLVGLALLAARAGSGLAAKDGAAANKEPDKPSSVPQLPKERLRYEGKTFEQWREVLFIDLSAKTLAEALNAMGAFGRKGYGPEAATAILKRMGDYDAECDDDPQHNLTLTAIGSLEKIGPAALPLLQRGLQDSNGNARLFAIKALPVFEDKAKPAIPALLNAIEHGDVKARIAAIEAMSAISKTDRRFISVLLDVLKDQETKIRTAAAKQLRMLELTARTQALSALVGALGDRDEVVRDEVMFAMKELVKQLGPKAKDAVPGLIAALKSNECNELHEVVAMLADIGPAAKDAVPVLTQLLKTPPPKSRYRNLDDGRCLQGYSLEGAFQCRVYDALEKITGKKPSSPRPQPTQPATSGYPSS
jgi:HEAT repeat protein